MSFDLRRARPKEQLEHSFDTHKFWLSEIIDSGIQLSIFEEDFVNDLETKFKAGVQLSTRKQEAVLERIYARTP